MAGALVGFGLSSMTSPQLTAGTFQSNFDAGIPPEISLFGQAATLDHSTGGVGNSGCLKLTDTAGSQSATAIISDFDTGAVVGGFDATFQLYIGSGTGADGFAFFFGDFADGTYSEEGPGTINGLTVTFDVYNNGGTPAEAPAIDVKWNNVTVFHRLVGASANTTPAQPLGAATTIRTQPTTGGAAVYWPVKVHVDTDGTLDVVYNNIVIVSNLPIFRALIDPPVFSTAGYRFGFSSRTGGSTDNHFVDSLLITTVPPDASSGQPFIRTIAQVPVGLNAGAAGGVVVELQDGTNGTVNPATVNMRLWNTTGNNVVTPTVNQDAGVTRIAFFGPNGILPVVGTNTVTVGYGLTSGLTNFFRWNFAVDPYITLPTNYALASVDVSQPGFKIRTHQLDSSQFIRAPGDGNLIVAAERHLALGYLDPATGLPYANLADLTQVGPDGYFTNSGVLNLNDAAPAATGQFSVNSVPPREDQPVPGIPFASDHYACEILTYIELKAGGHRFGFNSDDGFRASFGPGWDAAGTPIVGSFNGGRGVGEGTFFDVVVPQDGFYPLRISWWEGTGGSASAELFWFNPTNGQRLLVNDPDNLAAPRAYRASTVSRPSVTRALPVQNWIGAFPDDDVVIDITDGAIPLNGGSVALLINNVAQTIAQAKNGAVTTVTRDSSIDNLLPSGLNNVTLIYGFTESGNPVSVTNNYSFTVAPYYGVLPVANKVTSGVVTADTGFRGLVDQIDKSGDANQGNGARINGGWDSNRMPFPEIELFGGNINPTNGLRYPNLAAQNPNSPGGSVYDFNLVNWAFTGGDPPTVGNSGMFSGAAPAFPLPGAVSHLDEAIPGLPGAGTSPNGAYRGAENYVNEITTYLDLKRGVYVFGFNSDDGFAARSGPNVNDTLGTLLGFENRGKGNSGNLVGLTLSAGQTAPVVYPGVSVGSPLFSVIVQEDGIYPVRILYWQGGTGINAEFFTLNRTNGTVVLVNALGDDPAAVPAYRTYTGPAKPYVKFSICPNPWDSPVQQVGPGPINMVGRTRNAVNSSDIYNLNNTAFPSRPWANVAIGGVIGNGTSSATLGLLLNGTPVPATLTTNGADVTVAYQPNPPLPPGSTNTASLIYAGTTNSWTFIVQNYTTLNAADAQPLGAADPANRGFRVKMTQIAGTPAATVVRAESQILGLMGPDLAIPGPGPGGAHIYTNIINWNGNVQTNVTPAPSGVPLGNFQAAGFYGAGTGWPFPNYADEPFPGVPGTGQTTVNYAAAEVFAYLEFPTAGYYRVGVNSDDGFALKVGTPGQTNGTVIFSMDLGKGASDVPVSFIVPAPGLYPIRLVYYNGTGGAALEFFSYDSTGAKIPINDRNNPASIKAYYTVPTVALPRITSATIAGGSITVIWENGGTLWSAPTVNGPWTTTGDSDGSFTEPATGTMKFYRAILQQ